jgi:dihydroorotase
MSRRRTGSTTSNRPGPNLAGSITPHHLIINRNAILVGGIRPHYYCLPVAKRESHRLALRAAATSGDRRFFLGTDSAPHVDPRRNAPAAAPASITSINTMSCYAHVFEEEGALDRLEAFASLNGPAWYGLPVNAETITLVRRARRRCLPGEDRDGRGTGDGVRPDVSASTGTWRDGWRGASLAANQAAPAVPSAPISQSRPVDVRQ